MKTIPSKWQLEMIRAVKRVDDEKTECRKIWAERCGIEFQEVELYYINRNLCDLALDMGLIDAKFIFDLNPELNWKFDNKNQNFQEILFSRLASLFRLLDIKDIPGYVEYFNLTK